MFVLGQAALIITGGLWAFFHLNNKFSDSKIEWIERFSEHSLRCEKWFVAAGSAAIHSPDDHLGADEMIESFVRDYKSGHCDMLPEKWVKYQNAWFDLEHNPKSSPNEALCAEGFRLICEHKMSRDKTLHLGKHL